MGKKVLFGFDYTDNEFVKIILYLFVGGSAALIEWAFFYAFSEAAGKLSGGNGAGVFFIDAVPLLYVQYPCFYKRGALWQSEGTESGVPRQWHGAFV